MYAVYHDNIMLSAGLYSDELFLQMAPKYVILEDHSATRQSMEFLKNNCLA